MRQMLILKNQIVRSVEAMNIAYLKKCRKCGTFYASGRNAFLFCFLYIDRVFLCDVIIREICLRNFLRVCFSIIKS